MSKTFLDAFNEACKQKPNWTMHRQLDLALTMGPFSSEDDELIELMRSIAEDSRQLHEPKYFPGLNGKPYPSIGLES